MERKGKKGNTKRKGKRKDYQEKEKGRLKELEINSMYHWILGFPGSAHEKIGFWGNIRREKQWKEGEKKGNTKRKGKRKDYQEKKKGRLEELEINSMYHWILGFPGRSHEKIGFWVNIRRGKQWKERGKKGNKKEREKGKIIRGRKKEDWKNSK